MTDERSATSVRAEGPTAADEREVLMVRTLTELRQRARLLELLTRALAPLAYLWATLLLVSAAWGVTLAFPTIPRMVTAGLFSLTVGLYALMISFRKGTP